MIRDVHPGFFHPRSRGNKNHWIPDPDPQHCLIPIWIHESQINTDPDPQHGL